MTAPLVSIVTTSYNRAGFIGSTIESVLAQDYPDFEYLVVEDCSPDDSLAVARRYEGDPRLTVVANERNLGDYGNRNKALGLARGKYIKFVDCDDILYPHCLGAMLEVAERAPDAGVVFATRERPPWRYPVRLAPEEVYRMHFTVGGVLHQGPLSSLLRRDAVLAVGGFPEIYTGDVACWLNLAREFPVVLTGGGLFWWREHAGQLSESLRSVSLKWAAHQAEGARLHWEALNHPDCPLPAAERLVYQRRIERDYLRLMARNGLRGRWRVANELRRRCPFGLAPALAALRHKLVAGPPVNAESVAMVGNVAREAKPRPGGNPAVSVLVVAADAGEPLRATLDSVLAQSHDDWELLILDNTGSDEGGRALERYADGAGVRVERGAGGMAKAAAFNRCVAMARGRHLKFMEPGDTLAPRALRDFAWYATKFPDAGLLVSCADERFLMPRHLSPAAVYQVEAAGFLSVMESPSGVLYGRQAWVDSGGMADDRPEAVARLHLRIAGGFPVVFLPGGLVGYARGSEALRISASRGMRRTAGETAALIEALGAKESPLTANEAAAARSMMARAGTRLRWQAPADGAVPLPPAVAALCNEDAAFDRSLYP